jgi:hypothetical protein
MPITIPPLTGRLPPSVSWQPRSLWSGSHNDVAIYEPSNCVRHLAERRPSLSDRAIAADSHLIPSRAFLVRNSRDQYAIPVRSKVGAIELEETHTGSLVESYGFAHKVEKVANPSCSVDRARIRRSSNLRAGDG